MSTSCTKAFTLKVNPAVVTAIDAYWNLDEAAPDVDRVDSVTNLALQPTGPTDAGEPALIANGLHFSGLFGGQGYVTPATAVLSHLSADSFSFWGWFRINSNGSGGGTGGPYISFQTDSKAFTIACGSGLDPEPVRVFINPGASHNVDIPATIGDWHFFHLCWNSATQLFGYSIDNAAITYVAGAVALSNAAFGIVTIQPVYFDNTGDLLFDEIGITCTAMLTPTQQAYLYNSGAGRTWPITLP